MPLMLHSIWATILFRPSSEKFASQRYHSFSYLQIGKKNIYLNRDMVLSIDLHHVPISYDFYIFSFCSQHRQGSSVPLRATAKSIRFCLRKSRS